MMVWKFYVVTCFVNSGNELLSFSSKNSPVFLTGLGNVKMRENLRNWNTLPWKRKKQRNIGMWLHKCITLYTEESHWGHFSAECYPSSFSYPRRQHVNRDKPWWIISLDTSGNALSYSLFPQQVAGALDAEWHTAGVKRGATTQWP